MIVVYLSFLLSLAFADEKEETMNAMRAEWCGKRSCYDILEVPSTSNSSVIKDSYKRLSKEKHPDKCPDCDPAEMQAINNAYAILSSKANKQMYDRVQKMKKNLDAPKENVIIVVLVVLGLVVFAIHQYHLQAHHAVKKKILELPSIKKWFKKNRPEVFPEALDRKARKQMKKASKSGGKQVQEDGDPASRCSDMDVSAAMDEYDIKMKGWGFTPTYSDAVQTLMMFPMTAFNFFMVTGYSLVFHTLLGQEMSRGEKLYALFQDQDLDQETWDRMSWKQRSVHLKKTGSWDGLYEVMKAEEEEAKKSK